MRTAPPIDHAAHAAPGSAAGPARRRLGALLALVAITWAWYCHAWPYLHPGQEALRLYQVQALVERGEVHLDAIARRHGAVPAGHRPHGGRVYGEPAPGLTALGLPIYATALQLDPTSAAHGLWRVAYAATLLTIAAPAWAALWLLARWLARRTSAHAARLSVAALASASPLLLYVGLYAAHALAAALVAAAFALLLPARPGPLAPRRAWLGGALLGYAGLCDTPVFALGAAIAALAWLRGLPAGLSAPRALAAALPQVAPVLAGWGAGLALQLGYNAAALGEAWPLQRPDGVTTWLAAPSAEALVGLWLTPRRGLLYHAPWLAAAALGLALVAARDPLRERRLEAGGALAISAGYALFIGGWEAWPAGDQAGARHLLPIVPLLAWGLAPLWHARPHPLLRGALVASLFAGVLMHAPTAATFPYHFVQVQRPLLELAVPLMTQGAWSPSIGAWIGVGGAGSAAVFALLLAAIWWLALAEPQPGPRAEPRPWLAPLSAAVVLLIWAVGITAAVPERPGRAAEVGRYRAARLLEVGLHGRGGAPP